MYFYKLTCRRVVKTTFEDGKRKKRPVDYGTVKSIHYFSFACIKEKEHTGRGKEKHMEAMNATAETLHLGL